MGLPGENDIGRWVGEGDFEKAYEALAAHVKADGNKPHWRARLAILQNVLYRRYREQFLSPPKTVWAAAFDPAQLSVSIDPQAGFLLSTIHHPLPVEDLMALSGMPPFETLRTLAHLCRIGMVETR